MWFNKKTKAVEVEQRSKQRLESQAKLAEIKGKLETSFDELTLAINSTAESASNLNNKLKQVADQKPGITFISHTGKVLFANKLCLAILELNDAKGQHITKIYKRDGSYNTSSSLAAAIFSGNYEDYTDIDVSSDKFIFIKEPVVIEFESGFVSRPVLLRIALADTHPQSVSDIIFVCQITRVSGDELTDLERVFAATTNRTALEAKEKAEAPTQAQDLVNNFNFLVN